jgi:hypothetical protein
MAAYGEYSPAADSDASGATVSRVSIYANWHRCVSGNRTVATAGDRAVFVRTTSNLAVSDAPPCDLVLGCVLQRRAVK